MSREDYLAGGQLDKNLKPFRDVVIAEESLIAAVDALKPIVQGKAGRQGHVIHQSIFRKARGWPFSRAWDFDLYADQVFQNKIPERIVGAAHRVLHLLGTKAAALFHI